MDVRKIIREELEKVFEADYYDRYPDFLDPQFNPLMKTYSPVGMHAYGTMVREDSLEEDYPISWNIGEFKKLNSFGLMYHQQTN